MIKVKENRSYLDLLDLFSEILRTNNDHKIINNFVREILEGKNTANELLNILIEGDFPESVKKLISDSSNEVARSLIEDLLYERKNLKQRITSLENLVRELKDLWPESHKQYMPKQELFYFSGPVPTAEEVLDIYEKQMEKRRIGA